MFECLGEKESGKVRGGALMECVASTELSVAVKVNFNTTLLYTYEFSLCVSTWFYFSIMILLCAALVYAP
jgi:hypothetical protein